MEWMLVFFVVVGRDITFLSLSLNPSCNAYVKPCSPGKAILCVWWRGRLVGGMLHPVCEALVSLWHRNPKKNRSLLSATSLSDCSPLSWFLHSCSKMPVATYLNGKRHLLVLRGHALARSLARKATCGRLTSPWRLEKKWKRSGCLLVTCTLWYLLLSLSHKIKEITVESCPPQLLSGAARPCLRPPMPIIGVHRQYTLNIAKKTHIIYCISGMYTHTLSIAPP